MTPEPGAAIRLVTTKWGDRPHWEMDGRFLGSDDAGDWLGFPAGTAMSRPGRAVVSPNDQVGLVPSTALPAADRGWLATFHGPGGELATYVDVTTPPVWDGAVVRAVDLDLDVCVELTGRVFVDDEDEFAAHQVLYGYPPEIVTAAETSCAAVRLAAETSAAPFDGSHLPWLHRLREPR